MDAVFLRAKVTAMERIRKLHQLQYQQNQALKAIQTRIADEQRLAENIMNTAISQRMVAIDGVSSIVEPADVFSGDLVLQAKTDDDGWMVMLCDFTGHGLPAAVGTVPVTETFYSMASKGLSPESILNELNFKLKNFLPTNMFMGCIFFSYQPDQHIVRVWIGGMPTVLLKNGVSGAISHRLLSMDLPLGIIDKTQDDFHLQELSISSGDALVAYSDGLIEAENVKGHQLGMDRLENTVEDSAAEDLQAEILSAWQQFQAEGKQLDDVTLVTLNF